MNKVALFDFCETLANFQTADPFVDFVREEVGTLRMWLLELIKRLYDKTSILNYVCVKFFNESSSGKKLKLYQLKGLKKDTLDVLAYKYYTNVVKPNLIPCMIERLTNLQNQGYMIYLVSGGYDLYLKHFISDYGLSGCISTRIKFKGNYCTGRLDGLDCMKENKILLLKAYFCTRPSYTISFSDSITDIPLLSWTDEAFVVSRQKHQKWAQKFKFKEIIW